MLSIDYMSIKRTREIDAMTEKELIFDACLKSATDMGDKLKTLSWFGKNQPAGPLTVEYGLSLKFNDLERYNNEV